MEICAGDPNLKSEDRRSCKNFIPISILPIVSKLFEGEVFTQLYGYHSDSSLLSKFQSGFHPKHSTLSALIRICDDLLRNIITVNCVIFHDIRKAFDLLTTKFCLKNGGIFLE